MGKLTSLTDAQKQALVYIVKTDHTATVTGFDEDHDPIGPMLRADLSPRYLRASADGRLRLTEDGMEVALTAMYGRR
jgi:hypothetical protein